MAQEIGLKLQKSYLIDKENNAVKDGLITLTQQLKKDNGKYNKNGFYF